MMARVGVERRPLRLADVALALWIAMLAAVTVYGAATTTGFLTVSNMKAILTAASFVGIIAVGLTVIVLSGNLFSLALGQTAAISAMVFLYTLRFGLVAAILLTLAARPRDRRGPGLRGRRLGRQPDHRHDRRRRPHGGLAVWLSHGQSIVPPAGQTSWEHLANPVLGLPAPGLRLHRRHGHPRGGDAPDALRAPDLPPRREPRRRTGGGAADHAPHRRRLRDRVPLHGGLGSPDRRDQRERLAPSRRELHLRRHRGRSRRRNAVTGGRGSIARTALGAIFIATISDMLLLRGYSTGGQILVRGIIVVVVVVLTNLRERSR